MDKSNNELSKDNISINKQPSHLNITIHIPINQEDNVSDLLVKSFKKRVLKIPHKKHEKEKNRRKKYEEQKIVMPKPIKEEFDDTCIVFGEKNQEYNADRYLSDINNVVKQTSTQTKSLENIEKFKNSDDVEYCDFINGLNIDYALNENNKEFGQHVNETSKCIMIDNSTKHDFSLNANDFSIDCFKKAKRKKCFYQNELLESQNNRFDVKANEIHKIDSTDIVKQNESIICENKENGKCFETTITNIKPNNEELRSKIIQQNEIDNNSFTNEELSKDIAKRKISDSENNSNIQTQNSSLVYKNAVVEDMWNSKTKNKNNINYIELSIENPLNKEDNIGKSFTNTKSKKLKSKMSSNISTQDIDENISHMSYKQASEENNENLEFEKIQLSRSALSEDIFGSMETTHDILENQTQVKELSVYNYLKNADLLNKQQFEFLKEYKNVVTTECIWSPEERKKNGNTFSKTMENLSDKIVINEQYSKSKKKKKNKVQTDSSFEEICNITEKLNKHMLISDNVKDIYHAKISHAQKVLCESDETKYNDISSVYEGESILESQKSKSKKARRKSDDGISKQDLTNVELLSKDAIQSISPLHKNQTKKLKEKSFNSRHESIPSGVAGKNTIENCSSDMSSIYEDESIMGSQKSKSKKAKRKSDDGISNEELTNEELLSNDAIQNTKKLKKKSFNSSHESLPSGVAGENPIENCSSDNNEEFSGSKENTPEYERISSIYEDESIMGSKKSKSKKAKRKSDDCISKEELTNEELLSKDAILNTKKLKQKSFNSSHENLPSGVAGENPIENCSSNEEFSGSKENTPGYERMSSSYEDESIMGSQKSKSKKAKRKSDTDISKEGPTNEESLSKFTVEDMLLLHENGLRKLKNKSFSATNKSILSGTVGGNTTENKEITGSKENMSKYAEHFPKNTEKLVHEYREITNTSYPLKETKVERSTAKLNRISFNRTEIDGIIKVDKSKEKNNCKENQTAFFEMQMNNEKSTKTEQQSRNCNLDSNNENCSDYHNITKKNEEDTYRNRKRKRKKELDTQSIINDFLNNGALEKNKKIKLSNEDGLKNSREKIEKDKRGNYGIKQYFVTDNSNEDGLKNSQEKIEKDKRGNYSIEQYFLTDNSETIKIRTEEQDTESEVKGKQSKNDESILQFENISNIQSKMNDTTSIVSNTNKNTKEKSKKSGKNKKINDYFCSQNNELNNKDNLPILNEESTNIYNNLDGLKKMAEYQNTIKEKSKKRTVETKKAVDINKHDISKRRVCKPKSVKNKVIHESESSEEEEEEDLDSILDFVKTYDENSKPKKMKKNENDKSKPANKRLNLDSSDNSNSDSSVSDYAKEYNEYIHNKCSKNEEHCNSENKSKSKSKNSSLSTLIETKFENHQNNQTTNNINNSNVEENKQRTKSNVSKRKVSKNGNMTSSDNCDKHLERNKQNNNFDQSDEIENYRAIDDINFHSDQGNGTLELTESKDSESSKNSVAKFKKSSLLNFLTIKQNRNIENSKNIKNLNITENIDAVAGSKKFNIPCSSKDVDDVVTSDSGTSFDCNTTMEKGRKSIELTPLGNFKDSKTRNIIKAKDIYTDSTSSDSSGSCHDEVLNKDNVNKRTYHIERHKKEGTKIRKNQKQITKSNSKNDNDATKKHCEEITDKNCSQKKLVLDYFDKILSERYETRPPKPSNRTFKSAEFVSESDDTENSIRSRIGISDFETDKDKDPENEENRAKMMEIISCAEDELLNVMEENEQLQNLEINITWDVPMSHRIETRMSSCATKEQKEIFNDLGFKMKSGPFSKTEDDIIKENFKKFCLVHELKYDPVPFLNFNYGTVSMLKKKERINFARFLGRGLENRKLYRIYQRFKVLYSTYSKGRYTPQEDAVILEYMKIMKGCSKKFSTLSKILRRPRLAIKKRYELLQENFFKLSPKNYPNFVKYLMNITKVDTLEGLRNREITEKEWTALSKELGIYKNNLKIFWTASLYTKLFHKGPIHVDDIMRKLIRRLDKRKDDDYRKLNWIKLARPFEDVTHAFLYRIFKRTRNAHVPQELHSNLRRCVVYLKDLYDENGMVMEDIENIVLTL